MAITEGGNFTPTNNIVSPGVFMRENDYSGLAQGISNIGAAIVAPFADGPAFYPTLITDATTLNETFGPADGTYWGAYTAMEYLKEQGNVTVVRVGGLTGYWQKNPLIIYAEPGTWERDTDTGSLSRNSYMIVNENNIISQINYIHNSEEYVMSGSSFSTDGSPSEDSEDNYKFGVDVTGCLASTFNIIKIFDNIKPNSFTIDDEYVTYTEINKIKQILLKYVNYDGERDIINTDLEKYYITSLNVNNIEKTFDYHVVENNSKTTINRSNEMNENNYRNYMSNYDIAWFHKNKFTLYDNLYIRGLTGSAGIVNINNDGSPNIFDVDNTNDDENVRLLKIFNYIIENETTVSLKDNKPIINFPLVFVDVDMVDSFEFNNKLSFVSYNYDNHGSSNCVTSINVRYDTSTINQITGTVVGVFGSDKSNAIDDNYLSEYIEYINESGNLNENNLNGGKLYSGKTIQIGNLKTKTYKRYFVDDEEDGTESYYFLYDPNKYTNVTPQDTILSALTNTTEKVPYFSTSTVNVWSSESPPAELTDVKLEPNQVDFVVNGNVNMYNVSLKALRSPTSCGYTMYTSGILVGDFGPLNGSFTSDDCLANYDPCGQWDGTKRKPLILSVLANTLNAENQINKDLSVPGFVGSTIKQIKSNNPLYKDNETGINPHDSTYELELKYEYETDSGVTKTGSYGFYEFSLDESKNNYIKQVFGMNPRVGDVSKQVPYQKIDAAYNYLLFEDTIKKVNQEKTLSPDDSGVSRGWRLQIATSDKSFSIGEKLKFVDEASTSVNVRDSKFSITNAYTPWICSQKIAPYKGVASDVTPKHTKHKLFRVHTLSDGTLSNRKYKVEISNVRLAGTVSGSDWGTFSLTVRSFTDTDKHPKVLEMFHNLTLDPDSSNFIARRIGDYYAYITFAGKIIEFGTYSNASKHIRIEMTDTAYPSNVVPYGFEAYSTPIASTATQFIPTIKYSKASIYGLGVGKYASGTVFTSPPEASDALALLYPQSTLGSSVYKDTHQYFNPLPEYDGSDQNGDNIDFDLEDPIYDEDGTGVAIYYAQNKKEAIDSDSTVLAPELKGSIPSTFDAVNEPAYVKMRKFVVGFQGGFDGQWPAIPINIGGKITPGNTQGLDCTSILSPGSVAYKQCIAAIGNPDEFDINLVVTPGIFYEHHPYVATLVIDMCSTRGDCFYIMDNVVFPDNTDASVSLIDSAISCVASIDSSYVGTYYPWIKILDTNINKIIPVPPSVIIPCVFASNDKSSAEWYAPAGLNRGGITQAVQVLDRTTHAERDQLCAGRINPIASFPGQGIAVWEQKTLQHKDSGLSHINVRRLFINVKKYIASSTRILLFEPNVNATRNKFKSIVIPYLERIQQRYGLYLFTVHMNTIEEDAKLIDRGIMYGQLELKPTRFTKHIIVDFNILETGGALFYEND